MKTYIIKTEETITYRHEVEAETLEEAIEMVEDRIDGVEVDSSAHVPVAYAVEGQMGWTDIALGEIGQ